MTTPIAPCVGVNLPGQHSADRNQDATASVDNLDPKVSQDKKSLDVGANICIGNLDPDVDEKLLHDTFNAFGVIVTNPKIMRDPETGNSHGLGFISYDSFEASDAAIGVQAMNGQYLCNRRITVSYAYKKDTKGERHDTPAEGISMEEDFVVREINVYFNPSPIDEGTKLFVLQYPLRPAWRPYELDKECKIRVKPASTDVEIELPVDVDSKNFDPEAPSAQRFDKLTLSSKWRPLQRTAYTIGVLTGSELHLNPVFAIRQLRPSMEYLNPSAPKMKSVSEVATKARSSTAESSRNPNKVMDQKDNEPCIPLEFHGSSSHLSARYRAKMFAATKSPLTFPMKPLYYLDSLCPQAAIDKTKPAAQSKR